MKKGIIITLPRHDDETEYISKFSEVIIKEATDKSIIVKSINDKDANKRNFEKIVKKLDYKMIVFNGHGTEKCIQGYKNEILVESGVNEDIIADKIIYARVCNAASVLGRTCTKDNNGCFIGYELPFMFYIDTRNTFNPLNDSTSRLFLEPSNLVPISIIKGNTTKEAHENSKKAILKNINKLLRNKDKESYFIAEAMWNNYIGQVIFGDELATL